MNLKESKAKRIEILKKIDVLDKDRCEVCAGENVDKGTRCKCPAAAEVRKLGEELLKLSASSRRRHIDKHIREMKETGITTKLYRILREYEITSEDIQKLSGMTRSEYAHWKLENNLVNPKKVEAMKKVRKEIKRKKTIDDKYIKIANANGIPTDALYDRVFKKKWDMEKATTAKFIQKVNNVQEWIPLAEANGISLSTLQRRLRDGMRIDKAATIPVEGKRAK
ncbi:hypothetical protein HU147_18605 [Planomicrobium chinense]|uniref:hypothetical protein n=1 Tax=Planococcus chinensis TaxID=272917 RepID=UPI001CC44B51|nr:hypothetical protein [Planococcus chinensis]MBZ5203218.1 hypothetical protein [Planococcus chinensis]